MKNRYNRKGFNLVEMIIASVILSLAVVSICAVGAKSMTAVRSNRNYEIAWDLLDRQLTMIDYIGIEKFINEGQLSGRFGTIEEGIVHYWQAAYIEKDYDNLYRLNLEISWTEGSRLRKVSASTLLNGRGTLAAADETENTEGGENGGQPERPDSGGGK